MRDYRRLGLLGERIPWREGSGLLPLDAGVIEDGILPTLVTSTPPPYNYSKIDAGILSTGIVGLLSTIVQSQQCGGSLYSLLYGRKTIVAQRSGAKARGFAEETYGPTYGGPTSPNPTRDMVAHYKQTYDCSVDFHLLVGTCRPCSGPRSTSTPLRPSVVLA